MANLYTKTGDEGKTSLIGGTRVYKNSLRVNCYGTIDEANSMLGLGYSLCDNTYIREKINRIQNTLFVLAAELASDEAGQKKLKERITERDVAFLEEIVDKCTETTGVQRNFVVPGVDRASSALHVARTIVRRAERQIIELSQREAVGDMLKKYVNRLSDAIYALARLEETLAQEAELRTLVEGIVRAAFAQTFEDEPPVYEKKYSEKINFAGSVERIGEATTRQPDMREEGNMYTLEKCKRIALLAEKKAMEMGVPVCCTLMDEGGNVVLFHKMEGALLASGDISVNKAYTAVALKMPTDELAKVSAPGQSLYGIENTNGGRIVIFGGGFPIYENNSLIGGLGISGGTVDEDLEIGRYVMERIAKGEV